MPEYRASYFLLVLFGLLFFPIACAADEPADTVSRFVDAFNAHDVDAMLELAADKIRWMSVAGDKAVVEAAGHDELRSSMTDYFSSVPSARSKLRSLVASGPFVQAIEQAYWESDGAEKNQCSVSVYEIVDGKISNVWYFSAYQCP